LDCQFGKHYFKHKQAKSNRKMLQSTRKIGCPAHIEIHEYEIFPEYEVATDGLKQHEVKKYREEALADLRAAIKSDNKVKTLTKYFISMPSNEAHEKTHPVGQQAGMGQKVHPAVINKISELVRGGITDAHTVQQCLRMHVKTEYKHASPDDRAYYPIIADIQNHIYSAKKGMDFSKLDQENLQKKIQQWEKDSPSSTQYFRPYIDTEEDSKSPQSLLWIHQEEWQKQILAKYGNTITLIDATYKTTKYDVPLFLLSVRTNVGYCAAAEFVIQSESAQNIAEALLQLKQSNPSWSPPYFLCDYSEAELSAIQEVFPEAKVYLCDFHREQAWTRWTRDHQHGLSAEEAEELLFLLRNCAWAPPTLPSEQLPPGANYKTAEKKLQQSSVWIQHPMVQSWLNAKWLCKPEVSITQDTALST